MRQAEESSSKHDAAAAAMKNYPTKETALGGMIGAYHEESSAVQIHDAAWRGRARARTEDPTARS